MESEGDHDPFSEEDELDDTEISETVFNDTENGGDIFNSTEIDYVPSCKKVKNN